jgi:hypothetical protein
MAKHRSIKEQLRQLMTREEEDFLGRIGIVLHGTKAIAEYMGRSPGTISKWRTRYRGREEYRLCFPAMLMPTGKGWGFRMVAHTALIKEWMERWWQIDTANAQAKAKWKRKPPKVKRLGETSKPPGAPIEEKRLQPTREEPPVNVIRRPEPPRTVLPGPPVNPPASRRQPSIQRPEGCVCGSGLDCQAHDEPS